MRLYTLLLSSTIVMLFFITLVNAEEPSQVFKSGTVSNIIFNCIDNGAACSASTLCNITINKPDSTLLISNQPATRINFQYNYTLNPSQTLILGDYKATAVCTDGAVISEPVSFEFTITPSGEERVSNYYYLIIVIIYLLLFVGIWKEDISLTLLATFGLTFIGLYILFYGVDIYKNLYTNAFAIINLASASYLAYRMATEYFDAK